MFKLILSYLILTFTYINANDNQLIEIQYSKQNTTVQNTVQTEDTDNDTVINEEDKCPNTPDGVCVDEKGCIAKIKRTVHFDTGSHIIDKESQNKINSILEIAAECFGYSIIIHGHTDSTSSEKFNSKLSKQRAVSVKELMVNFGIKEERITIKWHGETKPISSNMTKEGRYNNRRVEILFY